MSKKPTVIIYDALTGEAIEQELSQQQILERQLEQEQIDLVKSAKEAARESALAKLAALGLTEAEIAAL